MLVQLTQAHTYRGKKRRPSKHAAKPRHRYQVGDIIELDPRYFERHLEPYDFAHVYNAVAAAEGASDAILTALPIDTLRELIDKHDIDVEATGDNDRATAGDMRRAIEAHFKDAGRTIADDATIPGNDELDDMRVKDLEKMCGTVGIEMDKIEGTGKGGNVIKEDLIDALEAERDRVKDEDED